MPRNFSKALKQTPMSLVSILRVREYFYFTPEIRFPSFILWQSKCKNQALDINWSFIAFFQRYWYTSFQIIKIHFLPRLWLWFYMDFQHKTILLESESFMLITLMKEYVIDYLLFYNYIGGRNEYGYWLLTRVILMRMMK